MPSLGDHIIDVINLGSEPKVGRIATARIVAGMTNDKRLIGILVC
jgi:hypothetical protein